MEIKSCVKIKDLKVFKLQDSWMVVNDTKFTYYVKLEELIADNPGISRDLLTAYMKNEEPAKEFITEVEWALSILKL